MSEATATFAFFRTRWATRYTDSCVIKRHVAGPGVLNQSTGVYAPSYTTIYTGPCLIRPAAPSLTQAGQELVATHGYDLSLPYTEILELPEDLVDITASTDAFLVGKQFVIGNIEGDTYITNRKIPCEDVTSG